MRLKLNYPKWLILFSVLLNLIFWVSGNFMKCHITAKQSKTFSSMKVKKKKKETRILYSNNTIIKETYCTKRQWQCLQNVKHSLQHSSAPQQVRKSRARQDWKEFLFSRHGAPQRALDKLILYRNHNLPWLTAGRLNTCLKALWKAS